MGINEVQCFKSRISSKVEGVGFKEDEFYEKLEIFVYFFLIRDVDYGRYYM